MILISININNRKSSSFSLANVEALAADEEDGYEVVLCLKNKTEDSVTHTVQYVIVLTCTGTGILECECPPTS